MEVGMILTIYPSILSPPTPLSARSEKSKIYWKLTCLCYFHPGISWKTLKFLDESSFTSAHRFYIRLPAAAATEATQVRWWQPVSTATKPAAVWSLDNIFIGGSDINPSELWEEFENSTDRSWEFPVNGVIRSEFCEKSDLAMTWSEGSGERHLTTGQMIVQENYMLQFKVQDIMSQQLSRLFTLIYIFVKDYFASEFILTHIMKKKYYLLIVNIFYNNVSL